jgi:hypothetical protein
MHLLGSNPMKRKIVGELECRESSSILSYAIIFIVYPAFFLFTCTSLLALFAIGCLQRLIAGSISLLAESIGSLSAMLLGILSFGAYAIWLLLTGEWGRLISLLPELLDWIRSFGLL